MRLRCFHTAFVHRRHFDDDVDSSVGQKTANLVLLEVEQETAFGVQPLDQRMAGISQMVIPMNILVNGPTNLMLRDLRVDMDVLR